MASKSFYKMKVDEKSVVRAWLYNFSVGGAILKEDHRKLLSTAVGPVIRDGGSIKLMGLASTTGPAKYDRLLGGRRADAVLNYLRQHFGSKFILSREISYGKDMALYFYSAKLEGGTNDNIESDLWRAVVVNAWNRGVPPPPPIGVDIPFNNPTWADDVGHSIDTVGFALGIIDFVADLAELSELAAATGPMGLGLTIVQTIIAMPLIWGSADAAANTNGQIQGAADALQDLADQYSSTSLDKLGLSKWPAIKVPELHLAGNPTPTVYQQAWIKGQKAGRQSVLQRVLDLEQHPKPITLSNGDHIRMNGRLWLYAISKAYGDDVGVKLVVVPANEELKKRGKPPYPTH
ncbi:MAG TPA: hypothetical protein VJ728_00010 [Candidatus Binataceae bacterium]|nr:hypothetical protein [Candidatus Binataceae bacterium]